MSRFGFLGVIGALVLAAGCVPSSRYDGMRDKYLEEQAEKNRLAEENAKLYAALKAKGHDLEAIKRAIAEMKSTGDSYRPVGTLTKPTDNDDFQIKDGVLVMSALNFRPGSAELTDKAKAGLDQVAAQFRSSPGSVLMVDGHTDSDPISHSKNASNWELSGKRAAAVVDYLVKAGAVKGDNAFLRGFAEFRPLGADKAKNRRVEIHKLAGGPESRPDVPEVKPDVPARPVPKTPAKKTPEKVNPNDPNLK